MTRPLLPSGLILDANVLIDYVESERTVLALIRDAIAPVHVASTILEEVRQVSGRTAERLGLTLIEPTWTQAAEAASERGRLSFQDRICLILARDHQWSCVTNDKILRRECEGAKVACAWGLEVIGWLVTKGRMEAGHAVAVAERMRVINPYITEKVVGRFKAQLRLQ